jgi:hypothetical protein
MISGIRYHNAALPAVQFNADVQKPPAHEPKPDSKEFAISLKQLSELPLSVGTYGWAVLLRNALKRDNKPA